MVKLELPPHVDRVEFETWFNARPSAVQEAVKRCPPWFEYRLKETGQRGLIFSYEEHDDAPVTVKFDTKDMLGTAIRVFGVALSSLERIK